MPNRKSQHTARLGFTTRAIWTGQDECPATGATIPPIYQSATYTLPQVGVTRGFDYSRTVNPTRTAMERQLAALEGGTHGCRVWFGHGGGGGRRLAIAQRRSSAGNARHLRRYASLVYPGALALRHRRDLRGYDRRGRGVESGEIQHAHAMARDAEQSDPQTFAISPAIAAGQAVRAC